MPADPIQRTVAELEKDLVLEGEQGALERLPEDLTYEDEASYRRPGAGAGGDPAPALQDEWSVRGDYIVRVHNVPRISLFVPTEALAPPPIPIDRIDVMRVTTTNSDNVDEMRIEDVWDGKSPGDHRPLSCRWKGETRFERIPENAKPGYYFVGGPRD